MIICLNGIFLLRLPIKIAVYILCIILGFAIVILLINRKTGIKVLRRMKLFFLGLLLIGGWACIHFEYLYPTATETFSDLSSKEVKTEGEITKREIAERFEKEKQEIFYRYTVTYDEYTTIWESNKSYFVGRKLPIVYSKENPNKILGHEKTGFIHTYFGNDGWIALLSLVVLFYGLVNLLGSFMREKTLNANEI